MESILMSAFTTCSVRTCRECPQTGYAELSFNIKLSKTIYIRKYYVRMVKVRPYRNDIFLCILNSYSLLVEELIDPFSNGFYVCVYYSSLIDF